MADLTNIQKREWAKILYLKENYTQQEIADKVGASRVTVNKWIQKYNWEDLKAGIVLTKEEQVKHLYRQVAEINDKINGKDKGERYPSPSEADTLAKLAKAIKTLEDEVGLADTISVSMKFVDFVRPINLDLAKEITRLFDLYIHSLK